MRALITLSAAIVLASCSAEAPVVEEDSGAKASASASATVTSSETSTSATSSSESDAEGYSFKKKLDEPGGGEMDFTYTWPAKVSAEPELAKRLGEHRDKMLRTVTDEWNVMIKDCPTDAVSCRNSSYSNEYAVVADLPRFLSLSNMLYTYSGGAHGLYGKDSSIWDREAKELLDPSELFTSRAAIHGAISKRACAGLDRERLKRRGGEIPDSYGEWPNNCPGMEETVLFVGSSNGKVFDRLGAYYGPYVAGAYAEGDYEINLPVDAAVMKAVKPEYARYFSVKR